MILEGKVGSVWMCREQGSMQAATKMCPQPPCTFSDTQMAEMITRGLWVTHV